MAKNRRQAYAVNEKSGMQHSAESWGTGRAVARIPRVSGGGTSRCGQAAFGNMVRKGRMFAPTKVWRHWHRRINQNQRRYATASALAASALPALVEARGHAISKVAEVPVVVDDAAESIRKTKDAVKLLTQLGVYEDVVKSANSKHTRAGAGKARNRHFVQKRGPLVVYNKDDGIVQAFRNLPGVSLVRVDGLNLLQLAPGGHLGRLVVWTQSAFKRLDKIFGTQKTAAVEKSGYHLPKSAVTIPDLQRLLHAPEITASLRAPHKQSKKQPQASNPLKNLKALLKLNPYAAVVKRAATLANLAKTNPTQYGKKPTKKAAAKKPAAAKPAAAKATGKK